MDLQDYRERIDKIDGELLRLFVERMAVSREIAVYKKEHSLPALDSAREKDKLSRVDEMAGGEMRPYANMLFKLLFELSRVYQTYIMNAGSDG
jgi:chorismate mutase/prephenate dehydratase